MNPTKPDSNFQNMTLREFFAAMSLIGSRPPDERNAMRAAKAALLQADALIKALKEEQ